MSLTIHDLARMMDSLPPRPPRAEPVCIQCGIWVAADRANAEFFGVGYQHTAIGSPCSEPIGWLCEKCGPELASIIRPLITKEATRG